MTGPVFPENECVIKFHFFFLHLAGISTTRNNSKVQGNNISLLVDTVHSLEVAQEFHFKKLDRVIEKVFFFFFLNFKHFFSIYIFLNSSTPWSAILPWNVIHWILTIICLSNPAQMPFYFAKTMMGCLNKEKKHCKGGCMQPVTPATWQPLWLQWQTSSSTKITKFHIGGLRSSK